MSYASFCCSCSCCCCRCRCCCRPLPCSAMLLSIENDVQVAVAVAVVDALVWQADQTRPAQTNACLPAWPCLKSVSPCVCPSVSPSVCLPVGLPASVALTANTPTQRGQAAVAAVSLSLGTRFITLFHRLSADFLYVRPDATALHPRLPQQTVRPKKKTQSASAKCVRR